MENETSIVNFKNDKIEIIITIPITPFIELLSEKIEMQPIILPKEDRIVCFKEAAELLLISESTMRRWVKAGKIKYIKRGYKYFFKTSTLEELNKETSLRGARY